MRTNLIHKCWKLELIDEHMGGEDAYFIIRGTDVDPIQGTQHDLRNSASQVDGEDCGWGRIKLRFDLQLEDISKPLRHRPRR